MTVRTNLPVSINQEKWLLRGELWEMVGTEYPPFNLSRVLRITGHLHRELLDNVLNLLIERHEILRASFFQLPPTSPEVMRTLLNDLYHTGTFPSGQFRHSILDWCRSKLPFDSLQNLNALEQTETIAAIQRQVFHSHPAYSKPPLMRAHLLQLAEEDHLLLLAIPHLVCDRLSMDIISQELNSLYRKFTTAPMLSLPRLTAQFSDFILRQADFLASGAARLSVEYWMRVWQQYGSSRMRVQDINGLPIANSTQQSAHIPRSLVIGGKSAAELRRFARTYHVTIFMLAFAALAIALYQVTGKQKIALRVHFANRTYSDLRYVVGWFVNTHLVGLSINPQKTVEQIVSDARSALLEASGHQQIPTTHLWRVLGKDWDSSLDEAIITLDYHPLERNKAGSPGLSAPTTIREVAPLCDYNPNATSRMIFAVVTDKGEYFDLSLMADGATVHKRPIFHILKRWCEVCNLLVDSRTRSVASLPINLRDL